MLHVGFWVAVKKAVTMQQKNMVLRMAIQLSGFYVAYVKISHSTCLQIVLFRGRLVNYASKQLIIDKDNI